MCLLAIFYRVLPDSPIVVAANREESFERPATPPCIRPGSPRVLCGLDRRAGGTWLGINELGVVVAVTNRPQRSVPSRPRSRGLLCLDLLATLTAQEAAHLAAEELATGRYAGANYVCLDLNQGFVVYGGEQPDVVLLESGCHLLTNGNLNDALDPRQVLARRMLAEGQAGSTAALLSQAESVCAFRGTAPDEPSIVLKSDRGGTVSSTLLAMGPQVETAVYRHADGPPDVYPYRDLSHLLRDLLDGRKRTAAGG